MGNVLSSLLPLVEADFSASLTPTMLILVPTKDSLSIMSILNVLSVPRRALIERVFPKQKLLADIRSRWGQQGERHTWRPGIHFELTRAAANAELVDDKTWLDLEFPEIFSRLDTTTTPLGRQYLFSMMRTYIDDPSELAERQACSRMLRSDVTLRESIQLKLAALRDDGHADIADCVFGEMPQTLKYPQLLLLWSAVGLLTLVAVISGVWPVWTIVATVAVNLTIIIRTFGALRRHSEALKRALGMLPVADALCRVEVDAIAFRALRQLREQAPVRKQAQGRLRWFALFQREPVQWVRIWFNVTFLVELVAYAHALKHFAQVRVALQSTYELLGSIDATVALASCLERYPDHCIPDISSTARIEMQDGYHPLLTSPVRNSLRLDGRSALIAGSNMAGKTTMIKMVGTNIILGRTLGFCLASRATIPRSSVMASIRREHSVESGSSHYFGEIERLQTFIESARRGSCRVFIIDELFSGTNTIERIAIAQAVLEELAEDAQVLVTTHDVELQQDLFADYDLYHFQENPDIEGFFDYRLKQGAAVERNAIRLLERVGFPEKVVARAMHLVISSSNPGTAPA